ncbi:hypothetical protein CBR_g24003 [Chara braunii]|uniref:Integrase catalytic domain-containing protein n=1 Tax=Chara braunii TaxID=69332 RepID=A0A388L5I2_CHABU|nr:hypothetical protein CBR_g24003 [Chara braunii]|eukprot:GBG77557.1 hypothetical protein CBR_g24003 [Chara braunii]
MDRVGVELVEDTVYLVVELEWRARGEFGGTNLELPGRVRATGSLYLSDVGWRTFGVALADGGDPVQMFDGAWQVTWREGFAFASPDRDDVTATVRAVEVGASILPYENVRMVLPPFLLERMRGVERVEMAVIALGRLSFSNMTVYREYYRAFLELGSFDEEQEYEVLNILQAVVGTRPGIPTVTEEVVWEIARREIGCGLTKIPEGSVWRYKPVGKKAKPVSILLEMTKEEAMEKEEEVLRVIRERKVAEGHRIPNEVAQTMKIGVKGFLTGKETQAIKEVCQESHLAFAFNDHQKGRLDAKLIPPVRIHTVEHECWNDKGPAYDFEIAGEVTELLRAKMDSFVAEPTASPYANKWFVFRKPNKSLRWIQDLQKLNAVTIRDAGSLPQADLLAESHAGRSIYFLIDLYSGYDQLPLDARDRPYTAMHTPVGQLQIKVTPMGFTNMVAEAQRRMLAVAGDMFPDKCEPYIDDNPVKGAREKDETETLKNIITSEEVTLAAPCFNDEVGRPFILETDGGPMAVDGVLIQKGEDGRERPIRFESRTLNSAERRYSQFKKEVLAILHCLKTFQAYLFGRRFILRIDPTNVAWALKNYKPIEPTVGRWVGFIWQFDYRIERIAGLRNRADGLSRVALTPEGLEEAEPMDAFLDYEGGTLVVDSEMAGTTCTTGELLIKALEKGPPKVVAELREGTVTRVGRREEKDVWGSVVKPRNEQIALAIEGGWRRVMSMMESQKLEMQHYQAYPVDNNQTGTLEEEQFFLIKSYEGLFREIGLLLVGNKEPHEVSPKASEEADRYVLRRGHLFRKEEGLTPRKIVYGRMRQLDIIQAMHYGLAGGHRSSKGTLTKITPLYYWSGMTSMIATYCQTCKICQERSTIRIFEPLRPTHMLGPGHMVHLDLAVMPVSRKGYRYILDARDNLSGFVEATALKKKSGFAVADWVEDFYLRHPFIRRFIADNGTEFVNQDVLNTCKRLGVPIKLTEPYHPEANAPVEQGHQTLKNTIAKFASDDLENSPDYLRHAVFVENMTPKRTTGCIPVELWYGREIDFPVEALVPTWNKLEDDPHLTTEQLTEARCEQAARNEEALEEIAHKVLDNRMKDKNRWDQLKNIRKEPLQVGEMVLVRNSALETTWSGQLGRRFKGPYRIARKLGVSTFEIENLDGITIRGPVPAQRLVRFLTRDPVEQWLQEAQDKEVEDKGRSGQWQEAYLSLVLLVI